MKVYLLVFGLLVFMLGFYSVYEYARFHDQKLHLIFCNVGQGDAAILRTPEGKIVLIDGGPDQSVLECLARNSPFWERQIDLMLLSHPHADHFVGLIDVIERYHTKHFVTEKLTNPSEAYRAFDNLLDIKKVPIRFVKKGDIFRIGKGIKIEVLAPTTQAMYRTSPQGKITDSKEFTNLILRIQYGAIDIFHTGDSQAEAVQEAIRGYMPSGRVVLLHVPHHGSRFGLSQEILQILRPQGAIISVGKNSYGHPAPVTLQLLEQQNIPIFRTDRQGDVSFVIDGKTAQVQSVW